MSPIQKTLTALAAAAALASVGYATAQSTDNASTMDTSGQVQQQTTTGATDTGAADVNATPSSTTTTDANGATTTTTTTTDTTTQTLPAPPTGVVELAKPKNTVEPETKQPNGAQGMENSVMTTGMTNGITRPSIGDHATPPIPGQPEVLAVTTERTTQTTTTPAPAPAPEAAAAPAPEPAAAPEPAPEPMPAPKADRN